MPTLGDVLFPAADYRRTTLSRLVWWESRRVTFNVAVGVTGLITLGVIRLFAFIPPGYPFQGPPWPLVGAYGLAANVCYTFGWGVETAFQMLWKEKAPDIGPALFRQGLAFSVGLTALPMLVGSMAWVARVIVLIVR